jgi:P4 family phage/plasmid primase-like protien
MSESSPPRSYPETAQLKALARGQWGEIYQRLLGWTPQQTSGQHGPCPNCGGRDRFRFTNMDGDGSVFCNRCLRDGGDGLAVLEHFAQCSFVEAKKKLAEYLRIDLSHSLSASIAASSLAVPQAPIPYAHERIKIKPLNLTLAAVWAASKAPITIEALQRLDAKSATYRTGKHHYECIALPIWGSNFSSDHAQPVGWILYNAVGPEITQYRLIQEEWTATASKTVLAPGSQPGILGDRQQLTSESLKQLWKLEGGSDLLSFLSIPDVPNYAGAFTNSSGCGQKPFAWIEEIVARKRIFVLHDCDEPGQEGANRWCEAIQKMGAFDCKIAKLPFPILPDHGKDLRDYLWESSAAKQSESLHYSLLTELPQFTFSSEGVSPVPSTPERELPPQEGDTNYQRLARVILQTLQIDGEPATVRCYNDEWYVWTKSFGVYRHFPQSLFATVIFGEIRRELERCNIQRQLEAQRGEVPLVPSITISMQNSVLNAMKEKITLNPALGMDAWVEDSQLEKFHVVKERTRKLIALKNGLFDLQAFVEGKPIGEVFLPHTPQWFSLTILPYDFSDQAPTPATFLSALHLALEDDQQRIDLLQEWMGYLIYPGNPFQKFLAFEGDGGNGKSAFLAVITALLGFQNCSYVPMEMFGDRFAKTATIGKLVNISSDVGHLERTEEGLLKSFVGGDTIFFDRKNREPLSMVPTAKLLMAWNQRPQISDRSNGVWRRLVLIPWLYTIPEEKIVRGMDQWDYWAQSGEMPGIFLWALQGLLRLMQNGRFTQSDKSREASEAYQIEQNSARAFLTECVEMGRDTEILGTRELYTNYRTWAEMEGRRPLSNIQFAKEVVRVFPKVTRFKATLCSDRSWKWSGIRLAIEDVTSTVNSGHHY